MNTTKRIFLTSLYIAFVVGVVIFTASAAEALHRIEEAHQSDYTAYLMQANVELRQQVAEGQAISDGLKLKYIGEFETTYYCCDSGATKSGEAVREGMIAVDTSIIPLGSLVYIENVGVKIAADTGGAIKGNIIDVYLPDYEKCIERGRIEGVKVWVVQ